MDNNLTFEPEEITVVIGVNNTVRWLNQETTPVFINSVNGNWTQLKINPNESEFLLFVESGIYEYFGHPWMQGKVVVLEFEDFAEPESLDSFPEKLGSDCRMMFGKGTPEMFECMEQFRDTISIPSAQEFLKMDCEDLTHLFPEFPSEKVADAWNTRMHECINEQESLLLQTELEKWNEVGCLEILNNTEMDFEDNVDKRAFDIRWRQCLENEN